MSRLRRLFGGGRPQPAPTIVAQAPVAPRPTRIPTEDDASIQRARRQQRRKAAKRKGRAATILTDNGSTDVGSTGQTLGA